MMRYYRRYLQVLLRVLPIAFALLRDRRRFVLFGPSRRVSDSVHRERAERLTRIMLDLGPAFVKVGQVLSTRPDIVPPTYVETFATLQDEVPEDIGGDPFTVLEAELGDAIDLETVEPIAGGSLAFVYTAVYEGERIALKVRRPDLVPVIERDLRVIQGLVPLIALFADESQQYSLENVADDFESIILDELDFERESAMMTELRGNFEDNERVVIPQVYPELCSDRVVAMEYVEGEKVTDEEALAAAGVDGTEMATLIARTYLQMGLVDGVFHADPHPGNLSVTPDGRLVIYDYGMSQRLTEQEQADLTSLYRALVRRDVDELVRTLVALEVLDPSVDRNAVRRVLEMVIENLEGRTDITWRTIITDLFGRLREFPFRIPPNVMLLVRVGTVGEGVCRNLDPTFDFLETTRSFLVDHGFLEREFQVLLEDLQRDLRESAPVVAGLPARADSVLDRLERGELVVRTDPVDARTRDAVIRELGYAVLTSAFVVASALLTFHDRAYEIVGLAAALVFFLCYVRSRRARTRSR
ncbi:ABC1 kinase family protein [Halopiger aswanensis]|uniref:Putative unusual protein kinase regulating ubiquinone biosynthesis (AarF/ABC1/UbiB family) n=1 Tax=Halopiger aswanensis TaxID=148449 RepID=A0A419W188_9EURY|nr:AarF/UbiB family protein [Halopiger aswanensis]RKD89275.1 putative unusual protein kinase regulating ubiquinone biosynthesis (AarF/ABC1/UbiB family) [Halopiger aswanensis]